MTFRLPVNEERRLRTLQLYRILDTGFEKAFDDLTRLAAAICEVPIGVVSLVDRDRQWFKSCTGLDATETPRSNSFCTHAILENDIMVVPDALEDPRFAESPLVTGAPFIRFYAGVPLEVDEKVRLGTLCVIDREPRQLSDHQIESLRTLRDAVISQLELRRARDDFQALENLLAMCAWCRSVRAEDGEWRALDQYVMQSVPVTHSLCPDCSAQYDE